MKRTMKPTMKGTLGFLLPIAAILAAMAIAAPAGATTGYGWLDASGDSAAVATADTAPPQTVIVEEAGGGFSWGDAFIGAGAALAVVLIAGISLYELRRHGRVTVAHPRA
jgi:hypothetical protein